VIGVGIEAYSEAMGDLRAELQRATRPKIDFFQGAPQQGATGVFFCGFR
jgi:hypothetical protein